MKSLPRFFFVSAVCGSRPTSTAMFFSLLLLCYLIFSNKIRLGKHGAHVVDMRKTGKIIFAGRSSDSQSVMLSSHGEPASLTCAAAISILLESSPSVVWPPVCPLPDNSSLRVAFARIGMPILDEPYCFAQRYESIDERVLDWSENYVDDYCSGIMSGKTEGTYGGDEDRRVAAALAHVPDLRGSRGMVIGSEFPWVECLALNAGAAEIWTFEYSKIVST